MLNACWRLYSLHKERTAVTLVLATILGLGLGFLREDNFAGMPPDCFWIMKTKWRECADMVLAGDSRVYRGLSPSEMNHSLPKMRILNYAFSAVGYSDSYVSSIENVLDPMSSRKTIILGIDPDNFRPANIKENGFEEYSRRTTKEKQIICLFGPILHFFRPFSKRDVRNMLNPLIRAEHFYQDFHSDGWVASYKIPENPRQGVVKMSKAAETDRQGVLASSQSAHRLLERVADWHRKGIQVCGLRSPASSEFIKLVNRLNKFDESAFISEFEKAGGRWLFFDYDQYRTYDGIHLHPEAAVKLSRDLAARIQTLGVTQEQTSGADL